MTRFYITPKLEKNSIMLLKLRGLPSYVNTFDAEGKFNEGKT